MTAIVRTAIDDIARSAQVYADARALLAEKVQALKEALDALQRQQLPAIRRAVERAANAQEQLTALVYAHPEVFVRPKTQVLSGIRVGYVKGKGSITFDSADAVVARIKKHLPEQAETLIRVKETPVKEALAQLSAQDLKKLGVSIADAGEEVVVRPMDGQVDKLVAALLDGATEQAQAPAQGEA